MKYKAFLYIPSATFSIEFEVDEYEDEKYVAEHIANAMNASFLYCAKLED